MTENVVDLDQIGESEADAAGESQPDAPVDIERKAKLEGTVSRLELYGAFIDIGRDTPAILHVSKLGQKVNRVADVLKVGDSVTVWVDSVDSEKDQVTVTLVEPHAVDWQDLKQGQVYQGKVTRLEKYGAFVDFGAEKEGLIHVSELSHDYVKHPSEAVKAGEEIEVMIIGFNKRKRRIDLSRKQLLGSPESEMVEAVDLEAEMEEDEALPTAMEIALRRAMQEPAQRQPMKVQGAGRRTKNRRQQQEDILNRTLNMSEDAE